MNISFFNGVSGLIAYQESMNRISHNIANSGTIGYKPSRSDFSDLLYTRMAVNSVEEPLVGHGVRIEDTQLIYRQGPVIQSGNMLDFGILGDGLFAVRHADGNVEYTRNGAFDISIEGGGRRGEKGYLVTADGSYVLDARGRTIELTRPTEDSPFDISDLSERIGIYDFPNPYGLENAPGSCLKETETSGAAVAINDGKEHFTGRHYQLVQSALEQSGVNLSDEMVSVITTQKAFQLNARMVQTADELEQVINNLR